MNNFEIIEELAKNKIVEEIISNISKGSFSAADELSQDIYLNLLEKSPDLIEKLYEKGELKYFIVRMVHNNLLLYLVYYLLFHKDKHLPIQEN